MSDEETLNELNRKYYEMVYNMVADGKLDYVDIYKITRDLENIPNLINRLQDGEEYYESLYKL